MSTIPSATTLAVSALSLLLPYVSLSVTLLPISSVPFIYFVSSVSFILFLSYAYKSDLKVLEEISALYIWYCLY